MTVREPRPGPLRAASDSDLSVLAGSIADEVGAEVPPAAEQIRELVAAERRARAGNGAEIDSAAYLDLAPRDAARASEMVWQLAARHGRTRTSGSRDHLADLVVDVADHLGRSSDEARRLTARWESESEEIRQALQTAAQAELDQEAAERESELVREAEIGDLHERRRLLDYQHHKPEDKRS